MKGRFIVVEGSDGSGKTTQIGLLARWLEGQGRTVTQFHFPQYSNASSYFVREYLAGHYGSLSEVGPEQASLFYALDRYDASFALREALKRGDVVISDRYVASNMGHQGAKIEDSQSRRKYYEWNDHLEYDVLGILRPDLNLVLLMPDGHANRYAANRAKASGHIPDLHEADQKYLLRAEHAYRELCLLFPESYAPIECGQEGRVLTIDAIHRRIRDHLVPLLA